MSDIGVEVDNQSIRKAMSDAGFSDFWIHFRTDNCSLDEFGQALNVATDPDGTFAEGGFQSPTGIVFLVSDLGGPGDFEDWMPRLVANLEGVGATGRLEGVKPIYVGDWPTEDPTPAAFLAWAEDLEAVTADEHRTSHWHIPGDVTEKIVDHAAAWTDAGGDRSIVYLGDFPIAVSPDADVVSMMNSSLIHNNGTANIRYQLNKKRGRMASLGPGGDATMQEIGAQVPWQQRLEAAHRALRNIPNQHLDLAFIRPAPRWTQSWIQIDMRQKLPDLREYDIRYNRHLLSRYTPDAHGIQILTDQHLSRARDLSSWNIQEIGHGRYLVEAEDLTPWYSTSLPDQDVVDQARHDFGDMILTKEVIAANPPPWRSAA
jgi:hypothetical protein